MAAVAHAVAHSHHHHHAPHGPLSLMSCVSRAAPSPLTSPRGSPRCGRHAQQAQQAEEDARHEPKKRSFRPLRGLRRMFRRKSRGSSAEAAAAVGEDDPGEQPPAAQHAADVAAPCAAPDGTNAPSGAGGAPRSASTGRLLADGPAKDGRRTSGGLYPGLSVSHDSVFTADPSDQSGSDTASTQSVQRMVMPGVRAELVDALRRRNARGQPGKAQRTQRGPGRGRRGDTSEDDEDLGLPRSPCSTAPDAEGLPNAKDQSTCSDGSLLSMGSSDLDEDSCGHSSRHSSKLSLHDKWSASADGGDLEVRVNTTPLSHSAARHKMAVKPKRTHGAPRRKRIQQLSAPVLPATPELNEELNASGRSLSPEIQDVISQLAPAAVDVAAPAAAPTPAPRALLTAPTPAPGYQLKSASLPPGAALQRGPYGGSVPFAGPLGLGLGATAPPPKSAASVTRSRSSAAAPHQDAPAEAATARRSGSSDQLDREQAVTKPRKDDLSFFGRLLSRRSGKKKKGERATQQPPAPVLPPSARAAATPAASAYFGVYAEASSKDAVDAAAPSSLPTRRLDEKGRYVADAETPPAPFQQQQQQQQQQPRPRQRLEPLTLTQRDAEHDAETEDDAAGAPTPRTTTPLDGVPIPVKPEPAVAAAAASRMQVSYSTSPPAPHWPASTVLPTTASDTKVVELIEKTPEARTLFEQEREKERESRLRLPGLSAFQQRVSAQMAHGDDAQDSSPLGEDTARTQQRRDVPNRPEPPSLPADVGADAATREREVLRHFDAEMSTLSVTTSLTASEGEAFSGAPDSLEPPPLATPASPSASERPPLTAPREADVAQASVEKTTSCQGKSSSAGSIEGLEAPASCAQQALPLADSPRSTHQITIPLGSSGLSITQRVADEDAAQSESHTVTVACVPEPATTPAPASPTTPSTATPNLAPSSTVTPPPPRKATAATAITLVSLPSLTSTPTLPDGPVDGELQDSVASDKDQDGTDKSDLPPEAAANPQPEPQSPPRPSALRKCVPLLPASASKEDAKVPEFMRVQLNRVDSRPPVNVVLSTGSAGSATASPERGGRAVLDPWAVEEIVPEAPVQQVSLLGLRVKRTSSKDDLVQPGDAREAAVSAPSSPSTPTKTQPPATATSASPKQSLASARKQPSPAKRMLSEDNNNVIIVEKCNKQPKTPTGSPPLQDDAALAFLRRKSASRDSLQLQWQSSVEEKESRDSSISPVLDGVVLRRKSLPREREGQALSPSQSPSQARDDTPELMKVFARRSLKVRDLEGDLALTLALSLQQGLEANGEKPGQQRGGRTSRDSDKENEGDAEGSESPKEERPTGNAVSPGLRFQRSLSTGAGQLQEQPPPTPPSPSARSPPGDKPAKPDKPVAALGLTPTPCENNFGNRLRTRKPDNVIANGASNIGSVCGLEKPSPPPAPSVVAKISARWTLPAEAKQAPVAVAAEAERAERGQRGSVDGETGLPKFKRIQQRREEWEQRAKALQPSRGAVI